MRNSFVVHAPSFLKWVLIGAIALGTAQMESGHPLMRSSSDVDVPLRPNDHFEQRAVEVLRIIHQEGSPCRQVNTALTSHAQIPIFVDNQRVIGPVYDQWTNIRPKLVPIPNENFSITPAFQWATHKIRVTISGDRNDISACQTYIIEQVRALFKKPSIT